MEMDAQEIKCMMMNQPGLIQALSRVKERKRMMAMINFQFCLSYIASRFMNRHGSRDTSFMEVPTHPVFI